MKTENILATRAHKVIYRDGDTAVKVFDANFPKTDVLNEALNQARVEETGLDIPKIHSVNVTEDGKWCIVSDYVEGKTLEQIMEEDPANLEKYMKEFVALQVEVHSKRAPLLNKLKDKWDNKIAASKALADLITDEELSPEYIIPKAFDKRVGPAVAKAVAEAAKATGVARI